MHSRKNNSVTKPKHKLIFYIINFETAASNFWIEGYYGIHWYHATMNWETTTPNKNRYYSKSELVNVNPVIRLKEFGTLEWTESCFWTDQDHIVDARTLAYELNDEKFASFLKVLNNPKEIVAKHYKNFVDRKVKRIFPDATDFILDPLLNIIEM